LVFSVFGFGFGFNVCEVRSSASVSVSGFNRTDKPRNRYYTGSPSEHQQTASLTQQHTLSGKAEAQPKTAHTRSTELPLQTLSLSILLELGDSEAAGGTQQVQAEVGSDGSGGSARPQTEATSCCGAAGGSRINKQRRSGASADPYGTGSGGRQSNAFVDLCDCLHLPGVNASVS
jgi:hypothetical protein